MLISRRLISVLATLALAVMATFAIVAARQGDNAHAAREATGAAAQVKAAKANYTVLRADPRAGQPDPEFVSRLTRHFAALGEHLDAADVHRAIQLPNVAVDVLATEATLCSKITETVGGGSVNCWELTAAVNGDGVWSVDALADGGMQITFLGPDGVDLLEVTDADGDHRVALMNNVATVTSHGKTASIRWTQPDGEVRSATVEHP